MIEWVLFSILLFSFQTPLIIGRNQIIKIKRDGRQDAASAMPGKKGANYIIGRWICLGRRLNADAITITDFR
jgi:hypothetical protein